jgi:hypothetical protein
MKKIEVTIRPNSFRRDELQVGRMEAGQFVQERGIWNVNKDPRLTVKREYAGRGAQQEVAYTIAVPEDYPLAIARVERTKVNFVGGGQEATLLYEPGGGK